MHDEGLTQQLTAHGTPSSAIITMAPPTVSVKNVAIMSSPYIANPTVQKLRGVMSVRTARVARPTGVAAVV